MELCYICNEGMETDTKYTLPERTCAHGHGYHANCIINWLCENYGECYQCRELHERMMRDHVSNRPRYRDFKYASSQARRKTASKELKALYAKYKQANTKYMEKNSIKRQFKADKMLVYRRLRNEYYGVRHALKKSYRSVNRIRNRICKMFPITESDRPNVAEHTELKPPTPDICERIIIHKY